MRGEFMLKDVKGMVFNIQRFTVHDGPGIRTEIFLKGCTQNLSFTRADIYTHTGKEKKQRK